MVSRVKLQHVQDLDAAVPGGKISYRKAGAGEALVLLHGVGSSAESWEFQLVGLSHRFQVLAWDAPGYGRSSLLPDELPEPADYARALRTFLDALAISRCHLVGHSMGSLIAAAFASRYPERLASLTLADCSPGYRWNPTLPLPAKLQARLDDLEALGPEGLADKRATNLVSAAAKPDVVDRIRRVLSQIRPDGYEKAVRMVARGDILLDLAKLRMPVLVLCGSEDKVTPEASVKELAATIHQAIFRSLPGLGHASYIEGPELFNAELERFISLRRDGGLSSASTP
jgi:pimeloyl-ACP methyl ester carboxylesterase